MRQNAALIFLHYQAADVGNCVREAEAEIWGRWLLNYIKVTTTGLWRETLMDQALFFVAAQQRHCGVFFFPYSWFQMFVGTGHTDMTTHMKNCSCAYAKMKVPWVIKPLHKRLIPPRSGPRLLSCEIRQSPRSDQAITCCSQKQLHTSIMEEVKARPGKQQQTLHVSGVL